jgi:hypothetical protein
VSAHDLFWLARYAYNELRQAMADLQKVEPSASLTIEMNFDRADIAILVHWERTSIRPMFHYGVWLNDKKAVDAELRKFRANVARLATGEPLEALV